MHRPQRKTCRLPINKRKIPTYIACMKSAGDNILRDDACKSAELKYQDARLNKIYKELIVALKPEAKNALIEAEKTWVQLKSADKDFESILYGDTQIDNTQRLKNDLFRTKDRAQVLDKYLKFVQIVGN
jgi:uncharacterized protein YecT (DUF1311 family)